MAIVTTDGKRITKRIDYSKGMPENAMDRKDLEEKFVSLAGLAIGPGKAQQMLTALDTIFESHDITDFCEFLGALRVAGRG